MMKTKVAAQLALGLLLLVGWMMLSIAPAYAGGDDCKKGHKQCGHDDGDSASGQAQSESESIATAESTALAGAIAGSYSEGGTSSSSSEGGVASAEGGSAEVGDTTATGGNAEGGTVGDININTGSEIPADTTHRADIRIENTPDVVTITPGSGDSCKAHVGFSASVPGIGTGMTIPLPGKECRKLKAYDRAVAMKQWQAAEIMFCSLKEVKAEFRGFGLDCVDILTLYVVPTPIDTTGQVTLTASEYDVLLVAQVQQEEFEDAVAQGKARYLQQQTLIEALQEEVEGFESEAEAIDRLKREAARIVAEQEARKLAEAASRAKFKKRLQSKENPDG